MDNLKIFTNNKFGKVRVLIIDGKPWFVVKDIIKILGYYYIDFYVDEKDRDFTWINFKNKNDLKKIKDFLEYSFFLNKNIISGIVKVEIVNESGLYKLISKSTMPHAIKFKKWIQKKINDVFCQY